MKGFRKVSEEEFKEFLESKREQITIKHLYDLNPELQCYMIPIKNILMRVAYIEDNIGSHNGRPNKYYINPSI